MPYVAFDNEDEAREYGKVLQAWHDSQHIEGTPRIIDCVCPTPDGRFALTWIDGDVPPVQGKGSGAIIVHPDGWEPPPDPPHWDTGNGEVLDTLNPLQDEGE
jgi:hypothetical protein